MSSKHDADQAGGEKEIVYSSDGGEPIKVQFPPKVVAVVSGTSSNNTDIGDAIITTDDISSEHAFEVFAGKLFYPTTTTTTTVGLGSNQVKYSNRIIPSNETALQKLSRIQAELNELKTYTSTTLASDKQDDTSSTVIKASFEAQIQSLQDLWGLLSEANAKHQQTLTSTIDAAVHGLSSSSAPPLPSTTTTTPVSSSLEERIKRLELATGAGGGGTTAVVASSAGISILERIQKLEKLNVKYDEKQSEMIQKRAKVIRQDLEAAAKARNKLMSLGGGGGVGSLGSSGGGGGGSSSAGGNLGGGGGGSGNISSIADDSKVIAALYDQLQSLSGMTEFLPVLASRVQILAQNHRSVSTWEERLHTTEQLTTKIQAHLTALEQAIDELQVSVQQNSIQMQQNIQSIDERITKLS